jgi:hypothetical protein
MLGPQEMVLSARHFKPHVGNKVPGNRIRRVEERRKRSSMVEKYPSIDLNIRNRIGDSLRRHYQAYMDKELSPRLLALIEKLKNEREVSAEEIKTNP